MTFLPAKVYSGEYEKQAENREKMLEQKVELSVLFNFTRVTFDKVCLQTNTNVKQQKNYENFTLEFLSTTCTIANMEWKFWIWSTFSITPLFL